MKRAPWLADVLHAADVNVVEHHGWQQRGRDFANLRAVIWHHDGSPAGDSPGVPAYMLREMAAGRAGAQLWVNRYGTWHVLAAGVAYHAGAVLPGKPGNLHSLGVELDHTNGEPWPSAQVDSVRRGTAAILAHLDRDEDSLEMHKTVCSPVGRKSDPAGMRLSTERAAIATRLNAVPAHLTVPEDDDMTPAQATQLAEVHAMLKALVAPRRADKVDRDPKVLDLGDLATLTERETR